MNDKESYVDRVGGCAGVVFYIVLIAGYLQVVKLAEKERRECKFRFIKFHSDGINHPPTSSL